VALPPFMWFHGDRQASRSRAASKKSVGFT
jgi:hypothetical protein